MTTQRLDEYLLVEKGQIVCRKCGHAFCARGGNYKLSAMEWVRDFLEVGLIKRPQEEYIDKRVLFRQWFCPGCFTNIENETALEDSAPIHDKQLS